MGWLEKIIVTPAHHRVHHAINKEYIDKNYGQIFIFWDKLFGTFQEELDSVPAVYGITRPVQTWNPIRINFMHMWLLIKDAWHTRNWKDKFRIWLMPTGWRPKDVEEKFPVYKIEDVYHFEKYDNHASGKLLAWSWVQLILLLFFVSYLFGNIAAIGSPEIFVYGAFIFFYVYAFTDLMDKSRFAPVWEFIKAAFGIGIVVYYGSWFGADQYIAGIRFVLVAYFIISFFISVWFTASHRSSVENLTYSKA